MRTYEIVYIRSNGYINVATFKCRNEEEAVAAFHDIYRFCDGEIESVCEIG